MERARFVETSQLQEAPQNWVEKLGLHPVDRLGDTDHLPAKSWADLMLFWGENNTKFRAGEQGEGANLEHPVRMLLQQF